MAFNDFSELFYENAFVHRHLGKDTNEQQALLQTVGFDDLDSFIDAVVPKAVRLNKDLDLPKAMSEHNAVPKAISVKVTRPLACLRSSNEMC